MNKYIGTNVLCLGLLGALALTACSDESGVSKNFGTTEEKNAFWNESANLKDWNVMKGSDIKLENGKSALLGRVSLKKSGDDLARAGIAYDVSNEDGSPTDLSQGSDGLCVSYKSDFTVEVRLDTADYVSSSVDKDVPFVSLNMKDSGSESHCASWEDFKMKKSDDVDGSDVVKKVRSVQLVFVGESGSTGEFSIQRLTPYVRSDLWIGKDGKSSVETGFEKGDKGTSGEITFFGDSSKAYFEWGEDGYSDLAERIFYNEGIYGNVVFKGSDSNPDVGFEFLVAGKTTKKSKDFIYTADVSGLWKGVCLEYESKMDIVVELVPGDSSAGTLENKVKTMSFAKNNDMEKNCAVFAEVLEGSDSDILKHLAKIRVKFAKKNKAGNYVGIRRISALVPENMSVKESGEYKEVKPTESSSYKSGKSFLWDGSKDGDHVDLGISGAAAGGVWTNSPDEMDTYSFGFPDDVEADDDGYVTESLVSKYHKFTGYVKSDDGIYDLDKVATIGFNTVSSKQEAADISAWDGFCIHYSTDSFVRIALVTDASANKYWYAEVEYSDDMTWGKVSWKAFKNVDEESSEKIEDAIGKITSVRLQFPVDGEFVVDKFGSYDQCGK